jgi:hypothetical protein
MPKPSLIQCALCVVGILGLQAFLMWLDNAPAEDLRFVLLAVPCALVAGLWIRRVREG